MTTPIEWGITIAQGALLAAALAASIASLRRMGPASHYGQLFLLNSLGVWLLISGYLMFNFRNRVLEVWGPGPTLGDAPYLLGYVVITASFVLLAYRFRSWRGADGRSRLALAVAVLVPAATLGLALLALVIAFNSSELREPYVALRLAYVCLDGAALGAVGAAFTCLRRAGQSTLARFYLLFGLAIGVNSSADALSAVLATIGERSVLVDVLYIVAGVFLVTAFIDHHRQQVRPSGGRDNEEASAYEDLERPREERVLAAFVRAHEPLLGRGAWALLWTGVAEAGRVLGKPMVASPEGRVRGAESREDWDVLLHTVRDRFREAVGRGASREVESVVRRYGREFAYLAN